MVTNCYCIQNNITYNENGMAVPDEDNNGRIIENTNFFFDRDYLRNSYIDLINDLTINMLNNGITQATIDMVNDCFTEFLLPGDEMGGVLLYLIFAFANTYTAHNLQNRTIDIRALKTIIARNENSWVAELDSNPRITFQQFMNYLANKIYFLGIQCIYNIQDVLNDNNIVQKENKIKKEIALCLESIIELYYMFNSSLVSVMSVGNYKYYNRDLVSDIDAQFNFWINERMPQKKEQYNLDHYKNLNI